MRGSPSNTRDTGNAGSNNSSNQNFNFNHNHNLNHRRNQSQSQSHSHSHSHTSAPNTRLTGIPKMNLSPRPDMASPPAYSPPRRPDGLLALAARLIQSQQQQQVTITPEVEISTASSPYTSSTTSSTSSPLLFSPQSSPESSSPISLRINTTVRITQNNNLVHIAGTPADHAGLIAEAVVRSLQRYSSGQCGIPMVDEEGCPRPLNLDIEAGMIIEGSGNLVGSREVINDMLREKTQLKRRRDEAEKSASAGPSQVGEIPPPNKRQRMS